MLTRYLIHHYYRYFGLNSEMHGRYGRYGMLYIVLLSDQWWPHCVSTKTSNVQPRYYFKDVHMNASHEQQKFTKQGRSR